MKKNAPATALPKNVKAFFGQRGMLSHWHPNYEFRRGQLKMAEEVEESLETKRNLIVEAGTGTGKTLAYLVPAILSGRRVIISTGTKNLQEQIFYKDIPFLQQHFSEPLKVCYMKGRSNYLCRQKLIDTEREAILEGLDEVTECQMIREWEKTTETGDRSEIRTLPENSTAWAKLDARRELCTGQKCAQFERCFITEMHRRASESQIIIVNHHLLFADLAVKDDEFGAILPEYTAVIFDEAHEIEDTAGAYFGLSISNHQVRDLIRDVMAVARRKDFGGEELDRVLIQLQDASDQFFWLFGQSEGRSGFQNHEAFLRENEEKYRDVLNGLELAWTHLELVKSAPEDVLPLLRRARELHHALQFWVLGGDPAFVYWLERRGRGVFLQATPIDVSAVLSEKLFDRVDTVILTSATLAVAGTFDFVKARLGIPHAASLCVETQFDYQRQAMLYVPQHLPDPRSPAFLPESCEEILRILELTEGRAFVLFTSNQQMRATHERVSEQMEYPALLQGTAPKHALLEEFRGTPNAVLFATSSFWQGVDVPGDQLSCVIIDRLPFAVPTDPVVDARIRMLRQSGGNPFFDYQIPQAAIALKQGFGRLIRSKTDRGVLALLDNRITKQRYGQVFFDSLPDYGFTTRWPEVEKFFVGESL
ncbi:MAG: ATP-dependent DNA helicase [Acidobacteria bacterium]|nr:ATP-dependent DNA helicase [Acidobacteriota bacterium]